MTRKPSSEFLTSSELTKTRPGYILFLMPTHVLDAGSYSDLENLQARKSLPALIDRGGARTHNSLYLWTMLNHIVAPFSMGPCPPAL